ncbi:MAG: response regulator receiver protein [Alphaproteobacteria bacterium]|nr:response regulator receiver protein [Alphaproteobacteria bacterium]
MPQAAPQFTLAESEQKNENTAVQGGKGCVLIVDDDRTLRNILEIQLQHLDYQVISCENGLEAFQALEKDQEQIDVILLDREMPVMDGMEFILKVKSQACFRHIPVIMVTGAGEPGNITEGIGAGVFYYIVKPVHYNILGTIVSSATIEAKRFKKFSAVLEKQATGLRALSNGHFVVSTAEQIDYLAPFLAQCFDRPEQVISGIAALLSNAVEHGNLGIGFDKKSQLQKQNMLLEEIRVRQCMPEHKNKKVDIFFQNTDEHHILVVRDQGHGFNWSKYMNFNPGFVGSSNGRGIAQARTQSFDMMFYNEQGNEVTALAKRKESAENDR